VNRKNRMSTVLLTGLTMAACQDLPTTITGALSPSDVVANRYSHRVSRDPELIQCFVSLRVEGREYAYEYGIHRIKFPSSTLAPDGSTRIFQYRIQRPNADPVVAGSCRIPNTPEAERFVLKRLHLERGTAKARNESGEISI